jgi:hypothetical protein
MIESVEKEATHIEMYMEDMVHHPYDTCAESLSDDNLICVDTSTHKQALPLCFPYHKVLSSLIFYNCNTLPP